MGVQRVKFINHLGKDIMHLDFSDASIEELLAAIAEGTRVIASRPASSVLTLTDVTNARFNDDVSQKLKEFTTHNKPYVRAAAVIGVHGLKKIIFEAVMIFSRRKLHAFDTIELAKDWLAKQ